MQIHHFHSPGGSSTMQIRIHSATKLIALSALLSIGAVGASQAQEKRLLKVTLLTNSYRDVLKLYGKPDEIQAGGPNTPTEGIPENVKASGAQGGFTPGKSGGGGRSGGGGAPGSFGGGGGAPGSFGGGNQYAQASRQGGGGAPGSFGGGAPGSFGGGKGGGLPGFGGTPDGGDGASQPSGAGGGGTASSGGEEEASREVTWWYHDLLNGLHKSFLFNKDGRVIQVQEYGHDKNRKGDRTRKGVALGSNLNAVLRAYGWSNEGTRNGDNLMMRYGRQYRVAFQMVKNTVVGITIGVGDK